MRLTRIYVETPLAAGRRERLTGSAARHLSRVLRLRVRDELTLFDGRGGEYSALVAELQRDAVWVTALEHRPIERESKLQLTLAQGISRGERMDWVVQKATELGVSRIVPLLTERSVVRLDARQGSGKLQHWRSIAIGACEQSGRNCIPEILAPAALTDFLDQNRQSASQAACCLLLASEGARSIADVTVSEGAATVLIGPEGGLSEKEKERATRCGYAAVRVGPRVLRTETAAVAALTLLQHKFGDL